MMKTKALSSLLLFIFLMFSCKGKREINQNTDLPLSGKDDFYEKCRMMVVRKKNIGKPYTFKIDSKEIDELEVKYLGSIITSENDTLKIINSINYTGLHEDVRRANANLFMYRNDKRIGLYHLGNLQSLPSEIKDNNLVFNYKNKDCDQTTILNLQDSIPKKIFINCSSKGGDLYTFER